MLEAGNVVLGQALLYNRMYGALYAISREAQNNPGNVSTDMLLKYSNDIKCAAWRIRRDYVP